VAQARQVVVLVVEDEPLLRLAAMDMVEEAGYEAIPATDTTQAIEILESGVDVRIIFTDIDMPPGLDGLTLAAMVRDRWPPIEIIITSGHYAAREITLPPRCIFFSKPYRESEVVAAMKKLAA